ncbi:hypothetical protein H0G86_008478 [Trichoderma simmonsii]|uniref:Uncharacterized protein n=1 Tax=Trichoderma simmonsii TaxID=1491479 RepID=A0A8G0LKS6_9HYPO|nr:hypothetical protein H0G86_008478 [Trichoderma simmonsii]
MYAHVQVRSKLLWTLRGLAQLRLLSEQKAWQPHQSDGRDDQQAMKRASFTSVSSWDSTIISPHAVRYSASPVPLGRCRQASRIRAGIALPNSRNQAPNPATQGVRDTPGTSRAVGAPRVNWLVVGLLPLAAADDSWGCL